MKSLSLNILLIFTVPTLVAEAQILRAYGLKVGTVVASQSFEYTINASLPTEARWGLDIGGFVELFDLPYFSMQPEIHYIQKGYSTTLPETTPAQPGGTGRYVTIRPRLDYLSIPILAKIRLETDAVTPFACVGPRFDFLLASNDNSLNYSLGDIGASVVAGIEFSILSFPQFLIEGRFSPSFTAAFRNQNLTVKNRSFEILVGVSL